VALQTFRELWDKVPPFCTRNKVTLGIVNNGSLVLIVWQTCSNSADDILDQSFERILPVVAGGVLLHFVFFAFNGVVTEGLSRAQLMPWKERKAVWLLTSQKTLPVAMTVLTYLAEDEVRGGRTRCDAEGDGAAASCMRGGAQHLRG
jgi:sodium/bile acid cotransporter 7